MFKDSGLQIIVSHVKKNQIYLWTQSYPLDTIQLTASYDKLYDLLYTQKALL